MCIRGRSGIYGGDSTQLSARSVLPKLVEMEEQYGSLTRGMLAAHKQMRARAAAQANGAGGGQPDGERRTGQPSSRRTIFTTLRGGLQQLVDALEARLEPAWVRKSTAVSSLEREDGG